LRDSQQLGRCRLCRRALGQQFVNVHCHVQAQTALPGIGEDQREGLGGDLLVVDCGQVCALTGVLERETTQVAALVEIDLRILVEVTRFAYLCLAKLDV